MLLSPKSSSKKVGSTEKELRNQPGQHRWSGFRVRKLERMQRKRNWKSSLTAPHWAIPLYRADDSWSLKWNNAIGRSLESSAVVAP